MQKRYRLTKKQECGAQLLEVGLSEGRYCQFQFVSTRMVIGTTKYLGILEESVEGVMVSVINQFPILKKVIGECSCEIRKVYER